MSDDFVVNVKQIGQYPLATSFAPTDVLLIQKGGTGGPYNSLDPTTLFTTALAAGGSLQLAPSGNVAWNGAALSYNGGLFTFSEQLQVPALNVPGKITVGTGITINGDPYITEGYLKQFFSLNSFVNSFNGRAGNVQLQDTDILQAGGVLATNPHFNGVVTAPTLWNALDQSDSVATTQWVHNALCWFANSGACVSSFNGRGGCVTLTSDDITSALTVPGVYALANTPPSGDTSKRIATTMFVDDALTEMENQIEETFSNIASQLDQTYAPLNSPSFTGHPTAPTPAPGDTSGNLATTAFVHAAVVASTTGVASFNTRTGAVVLTTADITGAGGAALASPSFTGIPLAPTATIGTNTTQIATTAYVEQALAAIAAGVTSFNTRTGAVSLTTADVTGVGGALLASPTFTGTPAGPTATPNANSTQLATTAYVDHAISVIPAPVTSFNGRTGAITFQANDISGVGGALLVSPNFTGSPTAPTPAPGNNTTAIATTAFVDNALSGVVSGVSSFNTRTGAVVLTGPDITGAGGALLAGPTFTGVPAAPTATSGTNTTQLATTAFVQAALAAAPGGVSSFMSRTGAITLLAADISAAGGALLASPAFTGNPTATTQTPLTSNTTLATTAFVQNAITAAGGVSSFNGRAGAITLTATDLINAGGPIYKQSDTAPVGAQNTFWFDSLNGQLYVQYVDPVSSALTWMIANSPTTQASGPLGIKVFATAGSSTYTPTAGMSHCLVECVGGGAGGGGIGPVTGTNGTGAGGGGSGGTSRAFLTAAQIGASQTVVVGAGGAGASAAAGGNGAATSLGSLCVANGGIGAAAAPNGGGAVGGVGGSTTGAVGDVKVAGGSGGTGVGGPYNICAGGLGGASYFGSGGVGQVSSGQGINALAAGSGGGGAAGISSAGAYQGGAGAPGICIITEFA